jgi:hypothetical protein
MPHDSKNQGAVDSVFGFVKKKAKEAVAEGKRVATTTADQFNVFGNAAKAIRRATESKPRK